MNVVPPAPAAAAAAVTRLITQLPITDLVLPAAFVT